MASKAQTLYLIDGHAQLYRAYHAIRPGTMHAADRQTPTNAVYGFANMLRSLRSRFKPDHLAAIFDPHGPVKREALYDKYREKLGPAFEGYKSQRDVMPDDLRPQIDLAFELCKAYGIPSFQIEGYEADDVLGTLAMLAAKSGLHAVIVTGDKDLLQLVNDTTGISVYDPMKDIQYDEDTVLALKGVKPLQIVDWLGFRGDSTDNIPGVPGVGDQTAIKLLQEHGSMETALEFFQTKFADRKDELLKFVEMHEAESLKVKEARESIKPPKGVKVVEAYLFAHAERARACRELAKLTLDLPLTLDLEALSVKPPEAVKLMPLLKKLDFRTLMRDIGGEAAGEAALAEAEASGEFSLSSDSPAEPAPGASRGSILFPREAPAAPAPVVPKTYILVDDDEKLAAFLRDIRKQKRIAVDTETTGTQARRAKLVGLAISWAPHTGYYLPVRGPMGEVVLDEKKLVAAVKPILEDVCIEKVGHHLKYDLQILRGLGIELAGICFDTMLAGWLLDPSSLRLNLDELSYYYLGVRKVETAALIGKGKKQITMDLVPIQHVSDYACSDVDCTWQLAELLSEKIKKADLEPLLRDIEIPLIDVLAGMEWTGVYIDAALLKKMSASLEEQLGAHEHDIYELAGERFNINSPTQLGNILFNKLGMVSKVKTSTGKESTSEEVLTLLGKEHELPRRILDFRGLVKLKNTYVDLLPQTIYEKTDRVHATFQQTGTETGRIGCSDPNLQNIPIRSELGRSIRAAFKPQQKGWKILAADYSQIELRILAHYSQDPEMLRAFEKGIDIHTAVAARLNNVKEEDVTREQRSRAKAVNFGIIYGQTAFGLSNTLGIGRREAQKIIDTYFATHSKVKQCIEQIIVQAREQGFVTTVLGRRRFIPQLKASDRGAQGLGERLAVNTIFQGSAADLIKKAMIDIDRTLKKDRWDAKIILQIHDELLFECPPEEAKALETLAKEKMEGALKLNVPLVVDAGIGDDWLSAKD